MISLAKLLEIAVVKTPVFEQGLQGREGEKKRKKRRKSERREKRVSSGEGCWQLKEKEGVTLSSGSL